MALHSLHGVVLGQVHGVFFRAGTQQKAHELGITGWVKNLPSGQVEFYAEGEEEKLKALLSWVQTGPPRAKVESVKVTWGAFQGKYASFEIQYD